MSKLYSLNKNKPGFPGGVSGTGFGITWNSKDQQGATLEDVAKAIKQRIQFLFEHDEGFDPNALRCEIYEINEILSTHEAAQTVMPGPDQVEAHESDDSE